MREICLYVLSQCEAVSRPDLALLSRDFPPKHHTPRPLPREPYNDVWHCSHKSGEVGKCPRQDAFKVHDPFYCINCTKDFYDTWATKIRQVVGSEARTNWQKLGTANNLIEDVRSALKEVNKALSDGWHEELKMLDKMWWRIIVQAPTNNKGRLLWTPEMEYFPRFDYKGYRGLYLSLARKAEGFLSSSIKKKSTGSDPFYGEKEIKEQLYALIESKLLKLQTQLAELDAEENGPTPKDASSSTGLTPNKSLKSGYHGLLVKEDWK